MVEIQRRDVVADDEKRNMSSAETNCRGDNGGYARDGDESQRERERALGS